MSARYEYRGIDLEGRIRHGVAVADDEQGLDSDLRARGIWVLEAFQRPERPRRRTVGSGMRRADLVTFCASMRFQAEAGIPLVQALEGFVEESGRSPLVRVVTEIRQQVEGGQTLSMAMESWSGIFPRELVQLVRVGEACGSLPEAFAEGQRHLVWTGRLLAEVRQATLHPLVVLGAATLFLGVLLTQVVPRLMDLLMAARIPLPGPTRFLVTLSSMGREHGGWILGLLVGVATMGSCLHRTSPEFRRNCDRFLFRCPVIGPVVHLLVTTRFAHNLGLLYRGGVPLPSALEQVAGVSGGPWVEEMIHAVKERLVAGETLSVAMRGSGLFPALMVRLVACGERTGRLDAALSLATSHHQDLLAQRIQGLTGMIEPILILTLVGMVGFIAVAMILPILSLLQSVR